MRDPSEEISRSRSVPLIEIPLPGGVGIVSRDTRGGAERVANQTMAPPAAEATTSAAARATTRCQEVRPTRPSTGDALTADGESLSYSLNTNRAAAMSPIR